MATVTLEKLQSAQAAAAIAYEVANLPESKRQSAMKAYDAASAALIEYQRWYTR